MESDPQRLWQISEDGWKAMEQLSAPSSRAHSQRLWWVLASGAMALVLAVAGSLAAFTFAPAAAAAMATPVLSLAAPAQAPARTIAAPAGGRAQRALRPFGKAQARHHQARHKQSAELATKKRRPTRYASR